jgi:hypothetical protein
MRVNPNNGAPVGTTPDGAHTSLPPGSTGVTAVSYTNAFTQPLAGGATTVYVLEPTSNQLFIQNPPNVGLLTNGKTVTLGGAPLDFGTVAGLDIPGEVAVATSSAAATGSGVALLNVSGTQGVYTLDLATGAATLLGTVPSALAGLAVGDAQRDRPKPFTHGDPIPDPDPGTGTTPTGTVPISPPPYLPPLPLRTTRPKVTKLTVTAAKGRKLTITFTASEAGRAKISLLREIPGRRKGKSCATGRRTGKRCTIRKAYGSITKVVAKAGKVTVVVKGKVGTKSLAVGPLRVEVTLRDKTGKTSAVVAKSARVRR